MMSSELSTLSENAILLSAPIMKVLDLYVMEMVLAECVVVSDNNEKFVVSGLEHNAYELCC